MEEKNNIIEKLESKIRESKFSDTLLSIFKTILAFSIYNPFASLISEYIPTKRLLRLEKFALDLAEDLNKIDDKIDTEFINTDEFAFIFEQCFKAASENYQKEKLESFKAIIINSALIDREPDNDEREYFLNLTNSLTVLHLKILKFMNNPRDYITDNNLSENLVKGGFSEIFSNVFPNVEPKTARLAYADLFNYGMFSTGPNIFDSGTSASGFELLGHRVSRNAERYISFITTI